MVVDQRNVDLRQKIPRIDTRGQVPKRSNGSGCKPDGFGLREFESLPALFRRLLFDLIFQDEMNYLTLSSTLFSEVVSESSVAGIGDSGNSTFSTDSPF